MYLDHVRACVEVLLRHSVEICQILLAGPRAGQAGGAQGSHAARVVLAGELNTDFFRSQCRVLLIFIGGLAIGMRRIAEASDPLAVIVAVADATNCLVSIISDCGLSRHLPFLWSDDFSLGREIQIPYGRQEHPVLLTTDITGLVDNRGQPLSRAFVQFALREHSHEVLHRWLDVWLPLYRSNLARTLMLPALSLKGVFKLRMEIASWCQNAFGANLAGLVRDIGDLNQRGTGDEILFTMWYDGRMNGLLDLRHVMAQMIVANR